jgi:ribA/ribD-fused uncharacterized protein
MDKKEPVLFYEGEFYPLSNFSSFTLEWKGYLWPTSEHAYHSEKFEDDEIITLLKQTKSTHDALVLAKNNMDKHRPDWMEIRVRVMKDILRAKVAQHPYAKKKLLDTGDREIIENSWRDDFWGWGPNKDGLNQLGKLWMEIREELKG